VGLSATAVLAFFILVCTLLDIGGLRCSCELATVILSTKASGVFRQSLADIPDGRLLNPALREQGAKVSSPRPPLA
jgi:hypothetical protein